MGGREVVVAVGGSVLVVVVVAVGKVAVGVTVNVGVTVATVGGCLGPGASVTMSKNAATPIVAPSAAKTKPRPARSIAEGCTGGGWLGIGWRMNGDGGAGIGPIDGSVVPGGGGGGCDEGIPCAGVGGSSGSSFSASGAITTESDGVTTGVRAGGFRTSRFPSSDRAKNTSEP